MSKKSKQNTKNTIYQGKTIIPDVTAVVTATLTKQGIIRLRGKLNDAVTGVKLEKGTGSAGSAEETAVRAQALVVRMVEQYLAKNAGRTKPDVTGDAIFSKLFAALSDREKQELT